MIETLLENMLVNATEEDNVDWSSVRAIIESPTEVPGSMKERVQLSGALGFAIGALTTAIWNDLDFAHTPLSNDDLLELLHRALNKKRAMISAAANPPLKLTEAARVDQVQLGSGKTGTAT